MRERVAEADVDAGRLREAGQRAVDRRQRVGFRLLGPRFEIRLVELDPVQQRLELAQLVVHCVRVRHCEPLGVAIVLVLRERRQRERPRHRQLDSPGGERAQESRITQEDGTGNLAGRILEAMQL